MKIPLHIKVRQTQNYECPSCHVTLQIITGVAQDEDDLIPELGDISICESCGTLLIIKQDGYKLGTSEDWKKLHPDFKKIATEMIRKPIVVKK